MNAPAPVAQPTEMMHAPAVNAPAPSASLAFDPIQFVNAHRIHVDGGSQFDFGDGLDGYLVVHPGELKNPEQLRKKLTLTLSLNEPSFFESLPRQALALNLGQLVPVSLEVERTGLLKQVEEFNKRAATNAPDKNLAEELAARAAPMAAAVREATQTPERDPVGVATLKNGLVIYELIRTRLAQRGYTDLPEAHVKNFFTSDQVLGDLQAELGISPEQIRAVAASGGVRGVGKVLGLGDKFVDQIVAMGDDAQAHQFSYNRIDNWIMGMGKLGLDAPVPQKIDTGLKLRVETMFANLQDKLGGQEVPEPVHERELNIAEEMKILPPKLLQAMYGLGYEICYTPDYLSDKIAHFGDIFGLNRKASNLPTDLQGTYRMYFSRHETLENQRATMVHEAHHVLFPELFTAQETAAIDQLFTSDDAYIKRWNEILQDPVRNQYGQTKFDLLKGLAGAYNAATDQTPEQKAAVLAAANRQFAPFGMTLDTVLPHLKDPERFKIMMSRADQDLRIGGERYLHGGYDDIPSRMREMVSRGAEIQYVRAHDDPGLMKILTPGLSEFLNHYYPLQLDRLLVKLQHHELSTLAANDNPKHPVVAGPIIAQPALEAAPATPPVIYTPQPIQPITIAPTAPPRPETPTNVEPPKIGPENTTGRVLDTPATIQMETPTPIEPPKIGLQNVTATPLTPVAPVAAAPIPPVIMPPVPPLPVAPEPIAPTGLLPVTPFATPILPPPEPTALPATPPTVPAPVHAVSAALSNSASGCKLYGEEIQQLHASSTPNYLVNSSCYAGLAAQKELASMHVGSACS